MWVQKKTLYLKFLKEQENFLIFNHKSSSKSHFDVVFAAVVVVNLFNQLLVSVHYLTTRLWCWPCFSQFPMWLEKGGKYF